MANQQAGLLSRFGASAALRAMLAMLLFAAAYFILQQISFSLRVPPFQRTTVWTPGALVFTALLLAPVRHWWIYYAGLCIGVFASFSGEVAIPVGTALLAAQFHFGAVALGAWAVRFRSEPVFGSFTSFLVFVVFAIGFVPAMTSAPIDLVRFVTGAHDVGPVALRSILAFGLGILIATPALTLTIRDGLAWVRVGSRRNYLEIVGLTSCLLGVGYFCFAGPTGAMASPALLYAPLPVLLWAAIRFQLAGICWALLALAFQSTWAAMHGSGPFTIQAPVANVLQLQLFLFSISLPLMSLAIVIQERRHEFVERIRSEEQFRLVVESTPNAILMVNPEGNIELANAQCEACFGYLREELIGQPVEVVVPVRYRAQHPGYRDSFFASPSARPMGAARELYGRRRDGNEFPVEIGLMPIQTSAGPLVLSTIVDITERKRSEDTRRELAHVSRLAMVGELTASIAHEINQPLGAILSNVDAAEILLESGVTSLDEVRQILEDIRSDDVRASEVIRRLRELLSKRKLEMQPLDLNKVISEVLTIVHAESLRRGVLVEADLVANLPAVLGDKVHLQQVLLNFSLNGMEAMAEMTEGKRLAVRSNLNENGCVEISVEDAGTGIPPERLARLFEPFFSTKREGMGLGLSIARSIVEAHGGRIWAENDHGGGAVFRFTIPVAPKQLDKKRSAHEA